jgi:hypothetical protein
MNIERVLLILDELGDERYPNPTSKYMRNGEFELQSYAHWAVEALKIYILARPDNPIKSVVDFMDSMSTEAAETTSGTKNLMFLTARDVAVDVWDILRMSEPEADE